MTDMKISDLTALVEAPATDDYIEIVDISEALDADKNKRITTAWLFNGLKQDFLSLLATVTLNGQTTTKQTVYTVPADTILIPFAVLFRGPSASLAGLIDLDIGGDAGAGDWIQQVSLNAFTATTDYGFVLQPVQAAGPPIVPVKKTEYAAAVDFGVKINTGSTGAANVETSLFGHLVGA